MPRPYASIVFAGLLFFPVLSVNSLAAQTRPAIAPAVTAAAAGRTSSSTGSAAAKRRSTSAFAFVRASSRPAM